MFKKLFNKSKVVIKKIHQFLLSTFSKNSTDESLDRRDSDHLFSSGEIFEANNDELFEALRELGTGHVPNSMVRHRQIIRGLTIDSIINRRHVEALEKKNTQLGYTNAILTIAVIIITLWSLFMSPQAKVAQNEVDNFLRQALQFCENNPNGTWPLLGGGETECSKVLETPGQ